MTGLSVTTTETSFNWRLNGRITVLDNGARLPQQDDFLDLMALNAFSIIAFDPASRLHDQEGLTDLDEFQLFPHVTLGNGEPATLFACLDAELSGTLEPLPPERLPQASRLGARLLSSIPVNSIALDAIEGLNSIDWLLLDDLNDSLTILKHGETALKDALLFQVRLPFSPTHQKQPDFARVNQWMTRHGFRFYRLNNVNYQSHLPTDIELERQQATQMTCVDALFIPDNDLIATLPAERLEKLAFLLDTIFDIHDFSYQVLNQNDPKRARDYLISRGYISRYHEEEDTFTLTAAYSPVPW
ncbi:hypothetical protein R5R73_09395 [Salinicola sp. LHM]|uniref:hypothetical protein n=1 Tax=Salinicola sp. LHM TaxID=3065298 RepID=UPI002ACEACC4|nr:hypothetical protein [Salinicola sp. LHM]WQH34872.1 hypothetical protein R5R73_09395 [Salinicola sp. LHM]